jgi:hypothetical protein
MVIDHVEHDGARLAERAVTRRQLRQLSRFPQVGEPGTAAAARNEALRARSLRVDSRRFRRASGS